MGRVINLDKYKCNKLDAEMDKCRADLAKYGRCHMIGGKCVSPKDFGRKKDN